MDEVERGDMEENDHLRFLAGNEKHLEADQRRSNKVYTAPR